MRDTTTRSCPASSPRQTLAAHVHPLFATRGPPGTHDLPLLLDGLIETRQEYLEIAQRAHRLDGHALSARDALAMATREGAQVLGWEAEIGSLEAGKEADLVVLATGQVANSGVDIETVPQDEPGKWASNQQSVLNMVYRQGKDLPLLKHGFNDSHFICFPYETRRTGIYSAGCVRQPMDSAACIDDAAGAALKAIQCVVQMKRWL